MEGLCREYVGAFLRNGYPAPPKAMGDILAELADAGFFRLRGVLVGTLAFQCYPAMLGGELPPRRALPTHDIDLAQFWQISVAVNDALREPFVDILRRTGNFTAMPALDVRQEAHSWSGRDAGVTIDLLSPMTGKERRGISLPSMGASATGLRFLDFLIHGERPAIVLHGAGIAVKVPQPERYAIHKLIISNERFDGARRQKDILQAGYLLDALLGFGLPSLAKSLAEAWRRGPGWRSRLSAGIGMLEEPLRSKMRELLPQEGIGSRADAEQDDS
jgi:hypothetical protein